jgi:hypothetical protein
MSPKLLRTSSDQFTAEVVVEWKGYITVRIGRNPRAVNLYWQLVDPKFSQLELGFESPSGRLMACSVPLFNGEVEEQKARGFLNAVPGTPFFDLSLWPPNVSETKGNRSHHIEQPGRIRLLKDENLLLIVIKDDPPLKSVLYADKLICNFGENGELLALGLKGSFPL